MKMPADVVEQAKQILGGKNLTAKRLKEMLADYAKLKTIAPAITEEMAIEGRKLAEELPKISPGVPFLDAQGRVPSDPGFGEVDEEEDSAPSREMCGHVLSSPGGSGRPDLYCGLLKHGPNVEHGYVEKLTVEETAREFPVTVPPELAEQATQIHASTGMDPVIAAILGEIRSLRQDMLSMSRATPEDKAQAMMGGKLPPTAIAGPIGYTGSAALPQDVWFKSPYGPPIEMKICGCSECPPHRKRHYYCPMCKSGPHAYTDYVGGAKTHLAPGATWGIQHVMCSPACWNMYLPLVDGRRRIRDGVPRKVDKPMPQFEGTTAGESETHLPEPRPVGSD